MPERAVRQQIASAVDLVVQVIAALRRHPQGHRHRRDHRHGRRRDHHAGHLRVRAHRRVDATARCSAASAPPASGRSAPSAWPPPASAAGRHVRARAAGGVGAAMPTGPIVLVFAVVFGVVVGAFWLFVQRPEQQSTQALRRRLKGERRATSTRTPKTRSIERAAEARSPPARRDCRLRRRRRAALSRAAARARRHGHAARAAAHRSPAPSASPARPCSPGCRRCGWSRCRSASPPAGCRSPFVRFRAERRVRKFEEQFPEAIELIARALRAGHAMTTGLALVAEELPEPVGTRVPPGLRPPELRHVDARRAAALRASACRCSTPASSSPPC